MENNQGHHVYDDIIENNNPMPGWWVWLFILTVIFGGIYYIHYTFGGGESLKQEFDQAMIELKTLQGSAPTGPVVTEEVLALLGQDQKVLAQGSQVFSEKCAMCHGVQLEGKIGPNLTDKYWIVGKGLNQDIYKVVAAGRPEKGMPAWSAVLKEDEVRAVTVYVFSKKGSNPAEAKAPQGEAVDN